jgi:dolichyl-phosphate-mannose--protein O-mannosyl transferase
MFFWGIALFRDEKLAFWMALLTLFNQLLYVQARIAMLDTFMVAFMVWAFAAFTASWWPDLPEAQVRKRLMAAGVLFGFSVACKWYGLMALLTCVGMTMLVYVFREWGVSFDTKKTASQIPLKSSDWYSPKLWKGITFQDWLMYLGLVPALVYFATFLPYTFFREGLPIWKFISFQGDMYGDQLRVVGSHPYMSQWKDWPLMSRPIWYAFDAEEGGFHRCVLLLGNPLIMWGGLLALGACAYGLIRERSREGFLILFFYLGLFGSWVLIPRKVSFYYYYYPAGMVLSLAMAYLFFCWDRRKKAAGTKPVARWVVLALAAALFIYFFPVLSGERVAGDDFRNYMWSNRWI